MVASCIAKTAVATFLAVGLELAAFLGLLAVGIPIFVLAALFWIVDGFVGYQSERLWHSRRPERWAVWGAMLGPLVFPAFWYCKESYEVTKRREEAARGPQQEAQAAGVEPAKPSGTSAKKWWALAGGGIVAMLGVLYVFGAWDSMLVSHGIALNMNKCYQQLGGGWRCCGPLGTGNEAECSQVTDSGTLQSPGGPAFAEGEGTSAFDRSFEQGFKSRCESAFSAEGSSAAALSRFCDCYYASLVDQVGLRRLQDLGLSMAQGGTDDLPYDVEVSFAAAYAECMSELAY